MNLIPFNLEIALQHPERVRHQDGRTARRVIHLPEAGTNHRVAVLWREHVWLLAYTEDGRLYEQDERPSLFLVAPEPERVPWDNVDEVPDGWFRHKASGGLYRWDFVKPSDNTVGWLDVRMSMPALFNHYEWHPDRRHKGPWNVCGKVAK